MLGLRNTFKRIVAALCFFTRLPLWRLAEVEPEHYRHVVPLWPLAGWLTGSVMVLVFWSGTLLGCPTSVGVLLALGSRVLLTGALHEDGLADFCDGFGGGTSRERTLQIMKDSHIGTFGVLSLVGYSLLMWNVLVTLMERGTSPWVFLVADTLSKYLASTIIYFLPYARPESESKNRYAYSLATTGERLLSLLLGFLPLGVCLLAGLSSIPRWGSWASGLSACFVLLFLLYRTMQRRLGGYTGDCCGATVLLTELTLYLTLLLAQ